MATSQKPTKKRQQISQAGRTMFTAVVVAALVFGVSMSISWHLFKKLQFNNLVITDLKETNKTATNNLKAAESLDKAVGDLALNKGLIDNRLNADQKPLAVIYDAMPIYGNSAALGSSLERKLLSSTGANVESISVELTVDDSSSETADSITAGEVTETGKTNLFSFKIAGTLDNLKKAMVNLEQSIRPMHVDMLTLERSGDISWLQVTGHTFFEHKIDITKGQKTIDSKTINNQEKK